MIFTYFPTFYLLVYIYIVDGGFLLNTFKEMYRQSCLNNYANSCTNNSQMHYINAISLMNCLFYDNYSESSQQIAHGRWLHVHACTGI